MLRGQESEALVKRIETLSYPGAEEARQSHTGRTAFGTARAAADFASDDQGTNTALSQIVVGRHAWIGQEHKEFGQKTFNPFAERMHEGLGLGKRRTHLPEFLLERMLECHPLRVLFAERQLRVRCASRFRSFVDQLDFFGPLPQLRMVRMQLF